MSDAPREWPNKARDARDRAAEAAAAGVRVMTPVVVGEREMTETEHLRRDAQALNYFQVIARLLESVGACTRP